MKPEFEFKFRRIPVEVNNLNVYIHIHLWTTIVLKNTVPKNSTANCSFNFKVVPTRIHIHGLSIVHTHFLQLSITTIVGEEHLA